MSISPGCYFIFSKNYFLFLTSPAIFHRPEEDFFLIFSFSRWPSLKPPRNSVSFGTPKLSILTLPSKNFKTIFSGSLFLFYLLLHAAKNCLFPSLQSTLRSESGCKYRKGFLTHKHRFEKKSDLFEDIFQAFDNMIFGLKKKSGLPYINLQLKHLFIVNTALHKMNRPGKLEIYNTFP